MVRKIVRDALFLSGASAPADAGDRALVTDLLDTLQANRDRCAGMAANMIGVRKRVIAFYAGPVPVVMVNPVIVKREQPYEAEEGCLSLDGLRKTLRYRSIEVEYLDQAFRPRRQIYSGWIAQVIQHEIDHCNGVLI